MNIRTARSITLVMSIGLIMMGTARGQQRIWFLDSKTLGEYFGPTQVGPDVDGDGLPELLIGASYGACVNSDDGYAAIVSTRNGELHRWCGSGGKAFGGSRAWVGDVDGGGIDDVAIGEPLYYDPVFWGRDTGRIQIYSTETKQLLYEIIGTQMDGRLGSPIVSMDDVDGDGVRDLLVGASSYGTSHQGQIWVYSMKSGSQVWTRTGSFQSSFGLRVMGIGDVDGDGVGDCATATDPIGSPTRVLVYSGTNGSQLLQVDGAAGGYVVNLSLAAPADLDGDGVDDFVFGGTDPNGDGYLDAYSVVTGAQIWRIPGANAELFGAYSCAVGDINHDGFDDFLVTSAYDDHDGKDVGRVDLVSGRSHRSLFRFYAGLAGLQKYGTVLTRGVDFNGDSFEDLIIGTAYGGKNKSQGGSVGIYAGNDVFLQADPRLPTAPETVTVDFRGGEPFTLGLIALTAIDSVSLFAPLMLTSFDANGELQLLADTDPSVSGHDFTITGYAENPSGRGPLMVSTTQTVSVQ